MQKISLLFFICLISVNLIAQDEKITTVQRALAATEYFKAKPFLTRGSTNSNIPIAMGVPAKPDFLINFLKTFH